jgi:hypothetical protein
MHRPCKCDCLLCVYVCVCVCVHVCVQNVRTFVHTHHLFAADAQVANVAACVLCVFTSCLCACVNSQLDVYAPSA